MATLVKGGPMAPFSTVTTLRYRGGRYSIPWIVPLYIYLIVLTKAESSTIFWVFRMTRPGTEPRSPGPLVNTLLIRPAARYKHRNNITMGKLFVLDRNIWNHKTKREEMNVKRQGKCNFKKASGHWKYS